MPTNPNDTADDTQLMVSRAGVARDGTRLARRTNIDAQWCRWYQGLARKMLGYREQIRTIQGIVRAIDVFSDDGFSYVHAGSGTAINRYTINNTSGASGGVFDRTPAGWVVDPNINWQFTELYNTADTTTDNFACGVPNASDISTNTDMPVYHGDILGTTALTPIADINATASGGVVAINPYLMLYGHDGIVKWSSAVDPLDFTGGDSGDSRPAADKIVKG